jgi:hypothetical protein
MAEEQNPPSETVRRLRETFSQLAARLKPEDEPAIVYSPEPPEE